MLSYRNLRRPLILKKIVEYLKEVTERIFMLRLGNYQPYFAGALSLDFKRASIMSILRKSITFVLLIKFS